MNLRYKHSTAKNNVLIWLMATFSSITWHIPLSLFALTFTIYRYWTELGMEWMKLLKKTFNDRINFLWTAFTYYNNNNNNNKQQIEIRKFPFNRSLLQFFFSFFISFSCNFFFFFSSFCNLLTSISMDASVFFSISIALK